MKIERVTLRQISMPLVHFFETSFGRTTERHMILVEVQGDGAGSAVRRLLGVARPRARATST